MFDNALLMSSICVTGILGRARRDFPLSLPSSDLRAAELLWRTMSKKTKTSRPSSPCNRWAGFLHYVEHWWRRRTSKGRRIARHDIRFMTREDYIPSFPRDSRIDTRERPHHATTTTFKSFYMVFMRNGSFLRPSSFLRTFPVQSAYRVKQVNYSIPYQGTRRYIFFFPWMMKKTLFCKYLNA